MFETHDSGKRFSFFAKEGDHNWDFVVIPLNQPWFYVTCSLISEEGTKYTNTFCFSDVSQLQNFSHEKNITLEFVDLVSPYYMNGTERWKMEPLNEIWLQANQEYPDNYEYVYLLKNGVSYTNKLAPRPSDYAAKQKIFEI